MQKKTKPNSAPAENKMGTMPIPKLLVSMSLPMIISMLVQALYNVVDSIFVAQINENALTAVSLAYPVQNLMIAVASGTGVGVNALLSRSLGEKNYDQVSKAAHNSILLSICSCIVFALIGIFGSRLFFCFTDGGSPDPGIRFPVYEYCLYLFLRRIPADQHGTSAAVDGTHLLYHDHSGNRCDHQYHF